MEENRQEIIGAEQGHMEFRLINPTEDGFLRKIQWNKDELEAAIRGKVAAYQNVVYTEDSMKQAKADRAELNKLTKAIEDRRKKVKQIVNAPYAVFEGEVKEVLRLIQEPVSMIDAQIKEMEKRQQDEKREAIREAYNASIGDLKEILPFERIFDSRYLNASCRLNAAKTEVKEKIERVRRDLETINSMGSKYVLNMKDVYIKTLDLSTALAENKRLVSLEEKLEEEKRRKAEEEARRKEEAEKRRQDEIRRQQERAEREAAEEAFKREREAEAQKEQESEKRGVKAAEDRDFVTGQSNAAETTAEEQIEIPEEKRYRMKFSAVGSRKQLEALIQYMTENGIEYGRI